jgi:hypothetical protein
MHLVRADARSDGSSSPSGSLRGCHARPSTRLGRTFPWPNLMFIAYG